jgi:hypothetical protein
MKKNYTVLGDVEYESIYINFTKRNYLTWHILFIQQVINH